MRILTLTVKVVIVLGPSYLAAWPTGEMVWVVPTLVGSGIIAASIGSVNRAKTTQVDEDGNGEGDEGLDTRILPVGISSACRVKCSITRGSIRQIDGGIR